MTPALHTSCYFIEFVFRDRFLYKDLKQLFSQNTKKVGNLAIDSQESPIISKKFVLFSHIKRRLSYMTFINTMRKYYNMWSHKS